MKTIQLLIILISFFQQAWGNTFAHWPLDEGSGTTAFDISGNGFDGLLTNGPTWNGNELLFDGVNDYVDIGSLDVSGTALSLTAWVRSDNLRNCRARDCRIISKATGTATQDHYWMLSTIKVGNKTRLRFRLKTRGSTSTLIASSGNLTDDELFHVAAVYDGRNMRLYKNGIPVGRRAKGGKIDTDNTVPVWIGGNPNIVSSRPWKGSISDVRVFDSALTRQEVNDIKDDEGGVDDTAPQIRDVQATTTETSAIITWTTNEVADSEVSYGLTEAYENGTISDAPLTTNHSITLTDLMPNTTYHYQVGATDDSGNLAVSADLTFTTDEEQSQGPGVDPVRHWRLNEGTGVTAIDSSGNFDDGTLINGPAWNGDELVFDGVNDYVDVGTLEVSGEALSLTAWVNSENLKNCRAWDCRIITKAKGTATQDHYWMLSTIKVGDKTRLRFRIKTNGSTTTLIASSGDLVDGELFHAAAVYDGNTMRLYKNGVEVGRRAKTGTIDRSFADVWIGTSPMVATSRPWKGTIGDVRVYAAALNEQQITAIINEEDDAPPVISNILRDPRVTTAKISWLTDEPADATVEYGLDSNYGETINRETLSVVHFISLPDLQPNTVYHFRVISKDASNNVSASEDHTFTTTDTPIISDIDVRTFQSRSNPGFIAATIFFSTNVPTTGSVDYGTTNSFGQIKRGFTTTGFNHGVSIDNLNPETLYHFRVNVDPIESFFIENDNTVSSSDLTFTTPELLLLLPGPSISFERDQVSVFETTVTITWSTDVPATSQVDFGLDSNYGTTVKSDDLVTEHSVTLTGLETGTWYRYQISSTDEAGNTRAIEIDSAGDFGDLFFITANTNPSVTELFCPDFFQTEFEFQDINGDNQADLVQLCNGFVLVRLGLGNARFAASQEYTVGVDPSITVSLDPSFIEIIDVNADTFVDLVILNRGSDDVSVLLGAGDGTFAAENRFEVGESVRTLNVNDVNKDNIPDLIITNSNSNTISVLLGQPNGKFGAQLSYPMGVDIGRFGTETEVVDINEDGFVDIIISIAEFSGPNNHLVLLSGNGDGSFNSPERLYSTNDRILNSSGIADVNSDNHLDIVVSSEDRLLVFLGNGDGDFNEPILHFTRIDATEPIFFGFDFLKIIDVNADNIPDIVGGGHIDDDLGDFQVWLGKGDGTFAEKSSRSTLFGVVNTPLFADFDKDGFPDLAVISCCSIEVDLDSLLVSKNRGDGTFIVESYSRRTGGFMFGADGLSVTDINGDGYLDIANLGFVLLNQKDGTFIGKRMTVE